MPILPRFIQIFGLHDDITLFGSSAAGNCPMSPVASDNHAWLDGTGMFRRVVLGVESPKRFASGLRE